ncbi:hypothetical protein KTO58_13395 [Chitinophaga pendula]|uniref:glycosyl hydrolase family 18 protein n=1 Tax=Chitinophaga TaxID=79328 RepID=UPI0012FE5FDD|nr:MULTISPECIES: glycosyl hydrolase family 18 protein [Chitinophaga]UCJ10147.1 hypothetical protein KTO58_13395 [Chitinophaga pendula]
MLLLFAIAGQSIHATTYGRNFHTYVNVIHIQPVPKDTAVRAKLIQRILNALKFTKNAHLRERRRIMQAINETFADSMVATARDIQRITQALSKQENQHYDSLKSLLESLCIKPTPVTAADTTHTTPVTPPVPDKVPDNDLNNLVDKIVPILQQKDESAEEKQRLQKLQVIRSVYGRTGSVYDTLRLNDSLGIRYTLKLAQQVQVAGSYLPGTGANYQLYNYNALTSFYADGYTLNSDNGHIMSRFESPDVVMETARMNGCNIGLTVRVHGAAAIQRLLQDQRVQVLFTDSLAKLLLREKASTVTIGIAGLKKGQRNSFTGFITQLSTQLHIYDTSLRVNVILPSFDKEQAYDLRALNPFVAFFLIDFTQVTGQQPGPLAPLKGSGSIDAAVSLYFQQQILPTKFLLLLSYYGTLWNTGEGKPVFKEYVSFSHIQRKYGADTGTLYDMSRIAAYLELPDREGVIKQVLWFDDASTLGEKYDYVLNAGLGGVVLHSLGADDGYGELWDELMSKLVKVDTVYADTVVLIPPAPVKVTFWERVKQEFSAYVKLFRDPCSVSETEYEGDTYFIYISVILFLLCLGAGFYYLHNMRVTGDTWEGRKLTIVVIVVLVLLLFFSIVMSFFLNKNIPWLGITDDPSRCNSVPLSSILIIFSTGAVIGVLIMRFLLLPFVRKDDVP